ncbi:serine/threonine-protein kinase MARK2-like [Teratosphaeria destructans]|uniref:Serine/threonine-protein kinase MARK2-like n=1 Tax=Teratosphaeria destructans TaxID=418781 RepID=A0A9W7SRZ1_9PEZI|nr:serine/threonine-protein kinase MARK2-like [Teratosphaeria destructans]
MPPARTQADFELQEQRSKLASSYQSLLTEFSSPDLHTVGNYTLGRLIGKGSFGKVYLASHKLTNGSKVVLKSAKKDDQNLAREIHHHRQFLHPHIARLYEVIVTETLVWLVLEYCPGDELYNHILQHGRMEVAKVQKIFTQLVGAVSYVHGKSCVHRDLKLENILLDKHDNVKLVDFGFTREYQGQTNYLQTWCGTVCYSAPEMLKGEKYAGEKVDVWSLGIILYALLCGELPFDEDDDQITKGLILKEEPKFPEHVPEPAKDLIKKLLSKRPLLRPSLGDILRDSWLSEHAPQQQEILKLQQPPAFSTQVEKDTLQRMKSAGVDIDMVIEHVLSQRCDSLAGWWALLIEKEQKKEKRRERKRKEREAEVKSLRRLSAASSRLLAQTALGEIHEGDEANMTRSPSTRGRRKTRPTSAVMAPELPRVTEHKSPTPEDDRPPLPPLPKETSLDQARPLSRPPPPPKDDNALRRPRGPSRGSSGSMLRYSTVNPDLLSPTYVPPPQRKRRTFYQQPLKEQLAWVKHWFKEGAKRAKSPNYEKGSKNGPTVHINGKPEEGSQEDRNMQRLQTGPPPQTRKMSMGERPDLPSRATMAGRPRINTTASSNSAHSVRQKRTSLSPGTLPHSSYRRSSAGLRGRKSTSSSVSSIRSAYQPHHQHTHSKASSTSSASIASPSGLSSASGSRLGRSPHASVKVLPSTPTGPLPSGIRLSRRPLPANLGSLSGFSEARSAFGNIGPQSPSLPVFARRKRSVFKGPMAGSPSAFGRSASASTGNSRSGSIQGRRSGEMITGITEEDEEALEEDEEEEEEEEEVEEVDHFGPELHVPESVARAARSGVSRRRGQSRRLRRGWNKLKLSSLWA